MRYKTLLSYAQRDKLLKEMETHLDEGIWSIDLDPKAEQIFLGPYATISEAHEARDYLWNYGDQYGRYLWVLTSKGVKALAASIITAGLPAPIIELEIDTTPLEVVGFRLLGQAADKQRYLSSKKGKKR